MEPPVIVWVEPGQYEAAKAALGDDAVVQTLPCPSQEAMPDLILSPRARYWDPAWYTDSGMVKVAVKSVSKPKRKGKKA